MTTLAELTIREAAQEASAIICEHDLCLEPGEPARWLWLAFCGCTSLMGDACCHGVRLWLEQPLIVHAHCEICSANYYGWCSGAGRIVPFG